MSVDKKNIGSLCRNRSSDNEGHGRHGRYRARGPNQLLSAAART